MKKERVNIKEASRTTGKSINTIRNWIKAEKVDAVKENGRWLISVDSLKPPSTRKKSKKKDRAKRVKVDQDQELKDEMQEKLERLEAENERLLEKEENLHNRIRKVFGPIFAPLVERLLETD